MATKVEISRLVSLKNIGRISSFHLQKTSHAFVETFFVGDKIILRDATMVAPNKKVLEGVGERTFQEPLGEKIEGHVFDAPRSFSVKPNS